MKDKSLLIITGVILVGTIALATGFERVPNSDSAWLKGWNVTFRDVPTAAPTHRSIDASGATAARVLLEQGLGDMHVKGAPISLAEMTFDTAPQEWLPAVEYSVDGTMGALSIVQPEVDGPAPHNVRNRWDVSLSDTMPVDLTVKRGVGEGTVDLSDVDVNSLVAMLGIGETTFDLSGKRAHDVSVDLSGGVGKITLVLPSTAAIRILADTGIGEMNVPDDFTKQGGYFVNDAYGKGGPTIDVHIKQGIGEIQVETE